MLTPVGLVAVDAKLELLAVELVAKGDELLGFKVFTVDVTLFEAEPSAFFAAVAGIWSAMLADSHLLSP